MNQIGTCSICEFWKRITNEDEDICYRQGFWKWTDYDPDGRNAKSKKCTLCGFKVTGGPRSNLAYDKIMLRHCKENHSDNIEECRITKVGECSSPKLIYANPFHSSGNGELIDGALYYVDSEEYGASLWTGENFGCVHWQLNEGIEG